MSWVLLSNDDGVDSPALVPFADALERVLGLPVHVAVPDGERSWSSKAVTREGTLTATTVRRGGRDVLAVSGTPADAVQLGLYGGFGEEHAGAPPTVVVTGINVGFNSGAPFLASSGTVWAAAEAAYAGVPAVAVSTGAAAGWHADWRREALLPGAAGAWARLAGLGAAVVRRVGDVPVPGDLVSVNLPWDAGADTAWRVTSVAPMSYGPLFAPTAEGWAFRDGLDVAVPDLPDDADARVLARGEVSITPVQLPRAAHVADDVRASLEAPHRPR